jgi:hypothetical protein
MTRHDERRRKPLFPNPFYLALLVASVVFTVTVFAYLIGPSLAQRVHDHPEAGRPGPGSVALAAWLDRSGPTALAVEFAVMFVTAVLAMATDRWFTAAPASSRPPGRPPTSV